jgi:hypothetical protein
LRPRKSSPGYGWQCLLWVSSGQYALQTGIRWLVALLVLLIDPSAVVLTIAASRRR